MSRDRAPEDPTDLIAEAYRMEGLGPAECRSIYLDWALGRPDGADLVAETARLLARYEARNHPMTQVLREGRLRPRPRRGRR